MATVADKDRIVRFGVFEADLRTGELRKHGLKLKLPRQPFHVLAILLENAGEAVTREEFQMRIWPEDTFVDFDHSLNTAINRIREVLGDSAESPRFVDTVPRFGYRFIAPVEFVGAQPPVPRDALPSGVPDGVPGKSALGVVPQSRPPRYTPSGVAREIVPIGVSAVLDTHRAKRRWRLAAALIAAFGLAVLAALLAGLGANG